MKLSTKGDYGVRVVLELARSGQGAPLAVNDLAERIGVPARYLGNLLAALRTGGVVHSVRGAHGGFSLGRSADRITVGEVVRLMDGPLAPIPCASRTAHIPCPTSRCPDEEECVLRDLWLTARDAVATIMDGTTFADLVARRPAPRAPAYQI